MIEKQSRKESIHLESILDILFQGSVWLAIQLIKALSSISAVYLTAKYLCSITYAQRGYSAYGGEWFLILGAGIGTWYLISRFIDFIN